MASKEIVYLFSIDGYAYFATIFFQRRLPRVRITRRAGLGESMHFVATFHCPQFLRIAQRMGKFAELKILIMKEED